MLNFFLDYNVKKVVQRKAITTWILWTKDIRKVLNSDVWWKVRIIIIYNSDINVHRAKKQPVI